VRGRDENRSGQPMTCMNGDAVIGSPHIGNDSNSPSSIEVGCRLSPPVVQEVVFARQRGGEDGEIYGGTAAAPYPITTEHRSRHALQLMTTKSTAASTAAFKRQRAPGCGAKQSSSISARCASHGRRRARIGSRMPAGAAGEYRLQQKLDCRKRARARRPSRSASRVEVERPLNSPSGLRRGVKRKGPSIGALNIQSRLK
jgi:hypothetical protein